MWLAERATNSGDTVVHPIVGEIIMSTIAMACAQDEGFDVVTDDGQVHRDISETDVASLYKALTQSSAPPKRYKATERSLCELVIFQQCDVTKLTPGRLAELSKDHEAIDAFRMALAGIAEKIPEMKNAATFHDRLKAAVDEALSAWKQDKANMSSVSKGIFGKDILKPTDDFV
jgi:hypothetical protein